MSTKRQMDRLCILAILLAVGLTLGCVFCIPTADAVQMGYETKLFDPERVHTVAIVLEDSRTFLDSCQSEEYTLCDVVIDGEAFSNVAIRGKGNTSLSSVASMDSDRYSFKLEFDHYDSAGNYYGLDKLSLNNLIYDNTMMKDYLVYQMMLQFDAAAPLCSFVYITLNGEDFGLYLAVEGVEESFLQRNYGRDYGELYKPDTMDFGGGRGNGKDFRMEEFDMTQQLPMGDMPPFDKAMGEQLPENRKIPPEGDVFPDMGTPPDGFTPPDMDTVPGGFTPPDMDTAPGGFGRGNRGMGSQDVKLQYIDDDPESYSNIFDSAKTDITDGDQARLIAALKELSIGENPESSLDLDAVLRYFVVHNFAVNGDSYTGGMIHNYYLYEQDGKLSMLPWDYNLAFGTFQGGTAASAVNDPIDTPQNSGSGDRPMIDRILADEALLTQYHAYFGQFLQTVDAGQIIDRAYALITPYVAKDPTRFCTEEEFHAGVETLKQFCSLRTQSILGQLAGTVPSTRTAQQQAPEALVDAADLQLSQMGSMGGGMGHPGGMEDRDRSPARQPEEHPAPFASAEQTASNVPWLLIVCGAVLLGGTVLALCYKRRK